VTRTETAPPALGPGGVTAFIVESETTVNETAIVELKATAVAFVKPEPVIDTMFPPKTGPEEGLMLVIVGAGIVDTTPLMWNEVLYCFLAWKRNQDQRSRLKPEQTELKSVQVWVKSSSKYGYSKQALRFSGLTFSGWENQQI
jgi:hypothetical protein